MADFIIEDDVPAPEGRHNGVRGDFGPMRHAIMELKPGQSFVVYGALRASRLRTTAKRERLKYPDKKFTIYKDKEPGFYRIWRVK